MTEHGEGWRPAPGTVWAGRSGHRYLVIPSGLLRPLASDDPGAVWHPDTVWDNDGPLIPAAKADGLAAHLRREALEVEHRAERADAGTRGEALERATTLRDRADRLAA